MATSKYIIAIGTMMIPVKKIKIASAEESNMKEIHAVDGCGARLGRQTICKGCGKIVPADQKGKGYAFGEKDTHPVQFTKVELATMHPHDVPQGTMQIKNFVSESVFPYKYFSGDNYALTPQDNNPSIAAALAHFLQGLKETAMVALVRYWDGNAEYNAVIKGDGILSEIFYSNEVKDEKELLVEVNKVTLQKPVVNAVKALIKKNTTPFDPATIRNSFKEALTAAAIEKKEKGQVTLVQDVAAPVAAPVVDLMSMFGAIDDADAALSDAAPAAKKTKAKKKA